MLSLAASIACLALALALGGGGGASADSGVDVVGGCLYKGVHIRYTESQRLDRIDNCSPEQCMEACGREVKECDFFLHHDNTDEYDYDYYSDGYSDLPLEYCDFFKRVPGGGGEYRRQDPDATTGFPSPCEE